MFSMISIGVNVIVLIMLFAVLSKLEDISRALRRLTPETPKQPPAVTPPPSASA